MNVYSKVNVQKWTAFRKRLQIRPNNTN